MTIKIKPVPLAIATFASTIAISAIVSSHPAEAFRKFWTQVKVYEMSQQEYQSVCGRGDACSVRNLDKFCQDKSGQWDAFYRHDGVPRCWVRRLTW